MGKKLVGTDVPEARLERCPRSGDIVLRGNVPVLVEEPDHQALECLWINGADADGAGEEINFRITHHRVGQALEKQHQWQGFPLVVERNEGPAQFCATGQHGMGLLVVGKQRAGIKAGDSMLCMDFGTDADAVGAGNLPGIAVPEYQMLVEGVEFVQVAGLVGPLSHGAEGFFPGTSEFKDAFRDVFVISQVALVTGNLEEHLGGNPVQFLLHLFRVARGRDRFGTFDGEGFGFGLELRLHGIDAVAQVAVQILEGLVVAHLRHGDRLADAHRNSPAFLVDGLPDKIQGTQHRVDLAQAVETLGTAAFNIDRNDRTVAHPDELDDGNRPWNVFNDMVFQGSTFPGRLIGGHLSGGEETDAAAVLDVLQRLSHSLQIALPGGDTIVERIHAEHGRPHFRHDAEQEVTHGMQVGTYMSDDVKHHQAVQAAEVMVGNQDKRPFARDVVELPGFQVIFDVKIFQYACRKVAGTSALAPFINSVGLVEPGHAHEEICGQPSERPAQLEGFLYIRFID